MRPKERRDSGQSDLFRARLDQIFDLDRASNFSYAEASWTQGLGD